MTRTAHRTVPPIICLLILSGGLAAQEKDGWNEGDPEPEAQLLDDFGSGMRMAAWALEGQDHGLDLRGIWESAAGALYSEKSDEGMAVYIDDFEANQQREELGQFGGVLKSEVEAGRLSEADAWSMWQRVMGDGGGSKEEDGGDDWNRRLADAAGTGNLTSIRLRIPDAGNVRTLVTPEFLKRDLAYFGRELELDAAQRAVIEALLVDYVTSYEARADELQAAIRGARGRLGRVWMRERATEAAANLDRLDDSIDWARVRERIGNEVPEGEKQDWMYGAIDRFQNSYVTVRESIERRRRELERPAEGDVDPGRVLQMAIRLQADRPEMRDALVEGMRLVLTEDQRTRLDGIIDQFILEQGRIDSRLGGSRIDLELALAEALEGTRPTNEVAERLDESTLELVILMDGWTNARIDRERSGLELFVAYDTGGEAATDRLDRGHARKATTELNAAIAVRDRLLLAREELGEELARTDPAAAERFRDLTLRQGFAPQLRTRWAERALEAALECTLEDAERGRVLAELSLAVDEELVPIRQQAVRDRIDSEVRVARARIEDLADDADEGARLRALGLEAWREPAGDRFEDLDRRIAEQLDLLLEGDPCAESLPPRRGTRWQGKENADLQKGAGKDGADKRKGADQGKAKGTGTGKSTGRSRSGGKGK